MGFRMSHTLVAALVVLLLAGCVPGDPIVTPEPEPDVTPVFASDDEALAAATEAYAKYRTVVDQIFMDGGADLSKLETVATGDQLEAETAAFIEVRNRKLHSTGGTVFETQALQRYDSDAQGGDTIVVAYICEDVTAVDVLDEAGRSVVSPDRPDRVLYEVAFDLASNDSDLLVSRKERWSESSC